MWIPISIAGGVILIALAFWKRAMRRSGPRSIDVGPVSEAWLAEQRARGRDTPY